MDSLPVNDAGNAAGGVDEDVSLTEVTVPEGRCGEGGIDKARDETTKTVEEESGMGGGQNLVRGSAAVDNEGCGFVSGLTAKSEMVEGGVCNGGEVGLRCEP